MAAKNNGKQGHLPVKQVLQCLAGAVMQTLYFDVCYYTELFASQSGHTTHLEYKFNICMHKIVRSSYSSIKGLIYLVILYINIFFFKFRPLSLYCLVDEVLRHAKIMPDGRQKKQLDIEESKMQIYILIFFLRHSIKHPCWSSSSKQYTVKSLIEEPGSQTVVGGSCISNTNNRDLKNTVPWYIW